MIQFKKLRLSGFKSFVDKTELEIGPGLNGIVGPNGCGKSNLVEAMRWVMGESSAKRIRGDGMEDVIFAGTDKRSPRNIAEVSLLLDNTKRQAPTAYNNHNDLEVVRKIERDKGSAYKINGKNARARDVQMLFADTVTGANSPALVSQGHVTRMINAKPHDRRLILEESAGIAGLYARRHEAELRLKAADTNLTRVEDILGSMESRLNGLKRQARQAQKYKNISAQIKQLELTITHLEWQQALKKMNDCKTSFTEAETHVGQKLIAVTQLTKTYNTQTDELPSLREYEANISAKLQKSRLDQQRHDDASKRHKEDVTNTDQQLKQADTDLAHEDQSHKDSSALLKQIQHEYDALLHEQEKKKDSHIQAESIVQGHNNHIKERENTYTALKETEAEKRARESSLQQQISRNTNRLNTLKERYAQTQKELESMRIDPNTQRDIESFEEKIITLDNKKRDLDAQLDAQHASIQNLEKKYELHQSDLLRFEKEHAQYQAEINMLEQFFTMQGDDTFAAIIDSIAADPGFEKALSRALGDSLLASLDNDAPTYWYAEHAQTLAPLPDSVDSITSYVTAPTCLNNTLSMIGLVKDKAHGERVVKKLHPGQAIVSPDGFYWRWDGYRIQSHATDRHALHLEQKNKHAQVCKKFEVLNHSLAKCQEETDALKQKKTVETEKRIALASSLKETEKTLHELRPAIQKMHEKNIRTLSEKKRLEQTLNALDSEISEGEDSLKQDEEALSTLLSAQKNTLSAHDKIEVLRKEIDALKDKQQSAIRDLERVLQEQNTRRARIQAIADERVALNNRTIRAQEQIKKLTVRRDSLREKHNNLLRAPVHNTDMPEHMLNTISELENQHAQAQESLKKYEYEASITTKALKEAEKNLSDAKEIRASSHALFQAAQEQLNTMETQIYENLKIPARDIMHHAAQDLVKYKSHDLPRLKKEKDTLTSDRNAIGAVNLQADEESLRLEEELTSILHERNDLTQAIEELRAAINTINKEARERLTVAFNHVNTHFQRLFSTLFSGGKAYLELIESDDPLGTGLEIYAQPPGKALQSLSLLSGGEQTLASIALIFAMFLTNPSPICVLDEIDAPLDDANVDRVCDLLDEIAQRDETRFLIITHHRLSMARMDRLYGVTMSEKGVSQLVSVDLQSSFDFLENQQVA